MEPTETRGPNDLLPIVEQLRPSCPPFPSVKSSSVTRWSRLQFLIERTGTRKPFFLRASRLIPQHPSHPAPVLGGGEDMQHLKAQRPADGASNPSREFLLFTPFFFSFLSAVVWRRRQEPCARIPHPFLPFPVATHSMARGSKPAPREGCHPCAFITHVAWPKSCCSTSMRRRRTRHPLFQSCAARETRVSDADADVRDGGAYPRGVRLAPPTAF